MGEPWRMALATFYLDDGTTVDGLMTVTIGGEGEYPTHFHIANKDKTIHDVILDTTLKDQTIVFDWDKIKRVIKLDEPSHDLHIRLPLTCDAMPVQNLSLSSIKKIVIDYDKTRRDRDKIIAAYEFPDSKKCPRFYSCDSGGDDACVGFVGNPPADLDLAVQTIQRIIGTTSGSASEVYTKPDAQRLASADADVQEAWRLFETLTYIKNQREEIAIRQKLRDLGDVLSRKWYLESEYFVYGLQESLLASSDTSAP